MQVLTLKTPHTPLAAADRAVALGLFDGVHLGHRRVLMEAVGQEGLRAAVFTFGRDAAALKTDASTLCSAPQKERLFLSMGLDEWLQADFAAYRDLSPEAFVTEVLHRQLHAKRVCCGFNFRFGKGGAGDVALLRRECEALGITVTVTGEVDVDGDLVSASRIRRLIADGDIPTAARLLGHPFVLDFPVSHGRQLGRQLGSPTINQIFPAGFVLPRFGVYTSTLVIDGKTYYGVSNVGVRPTVGAKQPLCETWIDGFDGDLYGETPSLILTGFVRPERPFPSVDTLKAQILTDRQTAVERRSDRNIHAVLFDFDDTLQNRRVAFSQYAHWFLHKYLPDLTAAQQEEKLEQMFLLNHGGYVDYLTFFHEMPLAIGIEQPPDSETLFKEYQRQFPRYATLYADATATLTALRARGLLTGIVTNGPLVQQHRKIDFAGIRPLLDTVLVSMEEGVHKPRPELFRRAAARLGLSPEQCVYVGDHPINDIQGACESGMKPIFIDTREADCGIPAVPTIHALSDLLKMEF